MGAWFWGWGGRHIVVEGVAGVYGRGYLHRGGSGSWES